MNRSIAFALLISLGHTSAALAGESLMASASRVVREGTALAASRPKPGRAEPLGLSVAARGGVRGSPANTSDAAAQREGGGAVASSGMSKKTKLSIYLGVAAAFIGTAYAIDHRVRDVTPSTLGTRQD